MKTLEELNLVDDFLVNSLTSHKIYVYFGVYSAPADRKAYSSATAFLLRRKFGNPRHSAGCISG